jgi:hypothetical protein
MHLVELCCKLLDGLVASRAHGVADGCDLCMAAAWGRMVRMCHAMAVRAVCAIGLCMAAAIWVRGDVGGGGAAATYAARHVLFIPPCTPFLCQPTRAHSVCPPLCHRLLLTVARMEAESMRGLASTALYSASLIALLSYTLSPILVADVETAMITTDLAGRCWVQAPRSGLEAARGRDAAVRPAHPRAPPLAHRPPDTCIANSVGGEREEEEGEFALVWRWFKTRAS